MVHQPNIYGLKEGPERNGLTVGVVNKRYIIFVEDIKSGTLGGYGAIVREIADRSTGFNSCSFSHEFRNSNFEPHLLAKYASSLDLGRHLWLGSPHDVTCVPLNIMSE